MSARQPAHALLGDHQWAPGERSLTLVRSAYC
jgi:hypothetical protein